MAEALGLAAGIVSAIANAERILFFTRETMRFTSIQQDLPLLMGLLQDAKNIFINSTEPIPDSTKGTLRWCLEEEAKLDSLLSKWMRKWPVLRPLGHAQIETVYQTFKNSVLLLNEIATTSMMTQIKREQIQAGQQAFRNFTMLETLLTGQRHLESGLRETLFIGYRVLQELEKEKPETDGPKPEFKPAWKPRPAPELRRQLDDVGEMIQQAGLMTAHRRVNGHEVGFDDDLDDRALWLQQRGLQYDHPNETVFTAVICPSIDSGQRVKRAAARCKLDTGADVNIITEEYVLAEGLGELIVQIPESEQIEIGGIEGFSWTPKRKMTLKFYLLNNIKTETAEFYLAAGLHWDLLLSQKYYAPITEALASRPKHRVLWLPKLKRTPDQVASQQEFDRVRRIEREAVTRAYEEREARKQRQKRTQGHLTGSHVTGHAWTLDEPGITGRAILPATSSRINTRGSSLANQPTVPFPAPPMLLTNGEDSEEYEMENRRIVEARSDVTPPSPPTGPTPDS